MSSWCYWLLRGPDFGPLGDIVGSLRGRHIVAALPFTLPLCFLACMALVVTEYGRVAGFRQPCPLGPNVTTTPGWLPARCELPVLEISTYAAVPGFSWEASAGSRHAFLAAALFVLLHLAVLCPIRVAVFERHIQSHKAQVHRKADEAVKRCCCGCCCPSTIGALWLFRFHLLFLAASMVSFVALPFYRCCEETDTQHRLMASQTIQCLIFSLMFDTMAMTQVLRAGVSPSMRRLLNLATWWGGICLVIAVGWSLLWTAKRWLCVGDGYSEDVCTLVFVAEWLLFVFLLLYFLPFSWIVHRLDVATAPSTQAAPMSPAV